jgi:hypothetical protein
LDGDGLVTRYEVYLTAWNDPAMVEGPLPISGLEFTLPLSDHGEATFSATVEPARSLWRPAMAPVVSGVIIVRDSAPVWSGIVWSEQQTGPRTFQFRCAEWGSFFERVPPVVKPYQHWNDHDLFRDLITSVQEFPGWNPQIGLGTTLGTQFSDLTINSWDDTRVEALFRGLGDAAGGPEWRFGITGSLDYPQRVLILADRMGATTPNVTLEYVETSEPYVAPSPPPILTLLGNLFPSAQRDASPGRRAGGNVIAHPARTRDGTLSATSTVAFGAGSGAAQLRATDTATRLRSVGYPDLLYSNAYPSVVDQSTLQRHATTDLNERAGLVTSYTLTTFDDAPDWTGSQPGESVQVILDTDVYADGITMFEARLLELAVHVSDNDRTLVNWTIATRLET